MKNIPDERTRLSLLDVIPNTDQIEPLPTIVDHNLSAVPEIRTAVSLFFKWLYPNQYVFIYREAFLSCFLRKQKSSPYYSEELSYAIAAIGAGLSDKHSTVYLKSSAFYSFAKKKALEKLFQDDMTEKGSSSMKLALIQTLLCLAFYNVTHGNNEMAWYFSGFAFRIVHEIGLHLNSNSWSYNEEEQEERSSEILSLYDTEVRSRIYWGCYLADHLISQLFGRVTTLSLSNSTVPETDDLPDLDDIEEFMFNPDGGPVLIAGPVKNLIILSRITSGFINRIFIKSHTLNERMENLSKFNLEMANWKSALPTEIQWSRELITKENFYDPTICCVWYQYYMALLSYNKPFVGHSVESRFLIETAIEDLFHLLKNWKTIYGSFEKCSLYIVYTAILAIQCMETDSIKKDHYLAFSEFLKSPTLSYALPITLSEPETSSIEPLSLSNFFGMYDPDFTLLNEINSLLDL